MKWVLAAIALAQLSAVPVDLPGPNARETEWSAALAEQLGGVAEHRLPDGSRVDILTDAEAIEVEWSDKWPEAIGQAIFYGLATGRSPSVYLLLRGNADEDYLRCLAVCRAAQIQLRTINTK